MKNYGLVLKKASMVCFGMVAIVGCRSACTTCEVTAARIEPQPMLVVAAQPRSTTPPPDPGIFANVPETRTSAPIVTITHAEDYTWLKGTLEYTHADSGHWKVRYAPLSEDDPFGGSVVLDPDVRLEKYHDGDLVYVQGELVRSHPSVYVSGPLYRVHSIRLISNGY